MSKKKATTTSDSSQMLLFSNKPNTTIEQREFITLDPNTKESIILRATAGSGKTFSCVERLKFLIEKGVDPSRIIFFSFTNAATEELKKRIGRDDIEIRTIHSFCGKVLQRLQKGKAIVSFMDFIDWFRKTQKPSRYLNGDEYEKFEQTVQELYDECTFFESHIASYKLQKADGINAKLPDYWMLYGQFLKETKSRDFSDMLIDVRDLFKDDRYLSVFKNRYDYIFVDEYQDTSSIQMQILLSLNAKYYYLIGDENQCLIGGTKVIILNNGVRMEKNIEEVCVGDKIFCCVGGDEFGYGDVTGVFRGSSYRNVVEIKTESGKKITSTETHTHFIVSNEKGVFSNIAKITMFYDGKNHLLETKNTTFLSCNYSDVEKKLKEIDKELVDHVHGTTRYACFFNNKKMQMIPATMIKEGDVMLCFDGGVAKYEKVVSTKKISHESYVYDLNVDKYHNFVANGIVTHNSIYGYSGASCRKIESMLKARRTTKEMSLTVNFRSDKAIVENSNKHSTLLAKPNSDQEGFVNKNIIYSIEGLIDVLKEQGEVAVLVRTNQVIKKLEDDLLKRHVPIKYFNVITKHDIDSYDKDKMSDGLKRKLDKYKKYFDGSIPSLIAFLKQNEKSKKFITTIHKSKGLEFDTCVVVNSIAWDVLEHNNILNKLNDKQLERISFDPSDEESLEAKNIHYVAVSRSKHKLFYMVYDF